MMKINVSGIGKELKEVMDKKGLSIEELSKKSKISIYRLNLIFSLESEPLAIPEMTQILNAFEMNPKEQSKFIDRWILLARKANPS